MRKIVIRSYDTDEIVKEFDVTGRTEREIDKLDRGLNINLSSDFYTQIIEGEEK
jgi:hypothetical protein